MRGVMVAAGSGLLLFGLWDTALAVLHPARRGPLSYAISRGTWLVVRTLSRRLGNPRLLSFAGPAAMAGGFLGWVGSLWIGFTSSTCHSSTASATARRCRSDPRAS